MKRLLCCGILAASMVAARVFGQTNVYSLNVGSYFNVQVVGAVVCESSWEKGQAPFMFGYAVNSRIGSTGEHEAKHTTMFLGALELKVPGDISQWLTKASYPAAVFGAGALFWMATTPRRRRAGISQERMEI